MTDQTTRLLRDAENYLSALHGSVARHDNLAANYGCAGCELRDKIAAELSAVSSVGQAPAPDQTALREAVAEVLRPHASLGSTPPRWEVPFFDGATPSLPRISGWRPLDEVLGAVLAVLPEPADRTAVLSDAERQMLNYALNQAQLRMWSVGGFTDEEQTAVVSLRRMTAAPAAVVSGRTADETQDETRRETVEYFVQSQQPDGTWESASSFSADPTFAAERLAARRRMMPDLVLRLAERTTKVSVQALPDCLGCRHWRCKGNGPCGALLDAWQKCPCTGAPATADAPAVGGAQQPTEARP
jgi:hypothetical protein